MGEEKTFRLDADLNGLCVDMSWVNIKKKKEKISGDYFQVHENEDHHILVLSDGLGSGIKANILATLTAQMLGKMLLGDVPIRDAIQTVARTLPVCKVRDLAYATFTVLDFRKDGAYLVQYDNPDAILIRNGKVTDYPINCTTIGENVYHESFLSFREEDMLILMSDGITNAGMGKTTYEGWGREDVAEFCGKRYRKGMSAASMAYHVAYAGLALNSYGVDDDMTVMVLRFCKPEIVNLMIGPPKDEAADEDYMSRFFNSPGSHVICGGTTARVAEAYLGKKLRVIETSDSGGLPSAMVLPGVDLVTEGQLTLTRLLEYCQEWIDDPMIFFDGKRRHDPAADLMEILFEDSTHVNIFFGKAENSGMSELELTGSGKQEKVERLIRYLKEQGKKVKIAYWAV